ncbi:Protein of unknown function (DUF1759) [Popillia japonica]|uniref:Reverse transcriptase domain-containing protein n=1 Tax=Popillia japonica TaxID=7064 RepID=A0AAW1KLM4_POPJA
MHHLRSCLSKEVLQTIQAFPISASNYKIAWEALRDRYEKSQLIVRTHVRSILDCPKLTKESAKDLRNLYDNINNNLQALKTLGEAVEQWDTLLIPIITDKLDNTSRRDWERQRWEKRTLGEAVEQWDTLLIPIITDKLDNTSRRDWERHCTKETAKAGTDATKVVTLKDLFNLIKSRCELLEKLDFNKSQGIKLGRAITNVATNAQQHFKQGSYRRCFQFKRYEQYFQFRCSSFNEPHGKFATNFKLLSRNGLFNTRISCLVLPEVTAKLPICSFNKNMLEIPTGLELADPSYNETEEVNVSPVFSKSEQYCEEHFRNSIKRNSDGRFVVKIPFKQNYECLGQSRNLALNRFYSQEQRLVKDQELYEPYKKFMREYESMGHMSQVNESYDSEELNYYMPHHAVVKKSSTTTQVRVVFDASMKTDAGISLNDTQHTGPAIQADLFSILLSFRMHEYVMANENVAEYPAASEAIRNNFYVDDFLFGADSKAELVKIQQEVNQILCRSGLELRKWLCNKPELCAHKSSIPWDYSHR